MLNILRKEMKLSASRLSYLFMLFGLMFLIPGYPYTGLSHTVRRVFCDAGHFPELSKCARDQ